jgi:predicted DNA-binding transcriptional regulator YafY
MAFNELIKNFANIRDYMREFYVYGFKSREDFTSKSLRSYDDSRRRIESWLSDHMSFSFTPDGKNVFISVDSRSCGSNPLFKAWKSKSFTDGDISLHFILMDILSDEKELTLKEILEEADTYNGMFSEERVFDISTVRKKLNEYAELGIVISHKEGRNTYYRRGKEYELPAREVLRFFSEISPCGVLGSFIEDKYDRSHKGIEDSLSFKHHYITSTIDSEILYTILDAMGDKCEVDISSVNHRRQETFTDTIIPLKLKMSAQSGRQYIMCFSIKSEKMVAYRVDYIVDAKRGEEVSYYDEVMRKFISMEEHIWGVSIPNAMEHVMFEICYGKYEEYIYDRLMREKRCGTVTKVKEGILRFEADVYDSTELVPWIRTFIGRITALEFSNKGVERRFREDLLRMYEMYSEEEAK